MCNYFIWLMRYTDSPRKTSSQHDALWADSMSYEKIYKKEEYRRRCKGQFWGKTAFDGVKV